MTPEVAARFDALPRLDRANVLAAAIPCKVCSTPAPFFDVTDFGQTEIFGPTGIAVAWHRCPHCGFLFTPLCDDWTPDEFRRFIYNDDHTLIDGEYVDARPRGVVKWMAEMLADHKDARILDYGGGNGRFAQLMREAGFHRLEAYDPISIPERPVGPFDIITCMEVIEHSPTPVETLADMRSFLAEEGVILLSEVLQPADIDKIKCSWWYCGTRNGHISTFADRTLVELCRPKGLVYHRAVGGLHAMRRGQRFLDLANRQGPPLEYHRLGAPDHGTSEKFHGMEDIPGWRFRWTAAATIEWSIDVAPGTGRIQVLIPFRNQSRGGFASECRISLGDAEVTATVRESSLFAEFDAPDPGPVTVTLRTPPLNQGAGADSRSVGIALRVVPGVALFESTDRHRAAPEHQTDPRADNLGSALKLIASDVSAWREARRLEMDHLKQTDGIDLKEQLEGYVRFSGPNWHHSFTQVMDLVAGKLWTNGRQLTRGEVFGEAGELRPERGRVLLPGVDTRYLRAAQIDEFERFELLPEFENPYTEFALPYPLNRNMGKAKAPPFSVYRARAADLFLSALGYQLFRADDGTYFPAASTRAYSEVAMAGPHVTVDGCVVVVQDAFEGTNFSHFLFDWVPRIGHFLKSGIENPLACMFIMGGIPSDFHVHVVQALCDIYALSENQFIFPRQPEIWHITGSVYFFSDLGKGSMHPANMAHPLSIAIIREVCSRIQTAAGEIKRIYISRGDTPLRRIANEAELFQELKSFGFVEIQLGTLPYLEQVKLVRGAEVIVAPHGMGLTHIAFHEGQPLIVELHNPAIGTDTYAFPARALGFKYRPVLGIDLGGYTQHFTISPRDVANVLLEEGLAPLGEADGDALSRIQTKFLGGVQSVRATEVYDVSPLRPDGRVFRHERDDVTVQPDNNCGWLEVAGLVTGAVCHCSCDVWLPAFFKGGRVTLSCTGLALSAARPADPGKTDQWQTMTINGIVTKPLLNFVLRCDADAGVAFYSGGWRFEYGSGPN
jgi:hypothetical protein